MTRTNVFIDGTPLVNKHLSGVGQVVLETVRALDDMSPLGKYRFILFLPSDEKGKIESYEFKNIKVKYLPFPHKFLSLFSRLPYSPPLDLFLGRGVYLFLNFRNWPLFLSKSITYVHDVAFLKHPEYIEPRNLKFLSRHIVRWLRQSTGIVTVSKSTSDELLEQIPGIASKVRVIVNAVNTELFKPHSESDQKATKKKYKLDDYVLFVSNIEPRKNIITLIEAFKNSFGKGDTQLFIVGGSGWLNESIMDAIRSAQKEGYKVRKNKEFVPDSDLPMLMQAARVLVVPSWHEGFGLPLVQAISSGGDVIASDIPALRESAGLVDKTKVTFFNPADSAELTKALRATKPKKVSSVTNTPHVRNWNDAAQELIVLVDNLGVSKK